jgi:hypothetical protein
MFSENGAEAFSLKVSESKKEAIVMMLGVVE